MLCSQAVERKRRPIGGQNETVAVDETHLARRKWTGNPQARRVPALWAFGGIQLSTRELFVRVVPVETGRTREALEQLIEENIKENTTIRTDYFRSYNHISEWGGAINMSGSTISSIMWTPAGLRPTMSKVVGHL